MAVSGRPAEPFPFRVDLGIRDSSSTTELRISVDGERETFARDLEDPRRFSLENLLVPLSEKLDPKQLPNFLEQLLNVNSLSAWQTAIRLKRLGLAADKLADWTKNAGEAPKLKMTLGNLNTDFGDNDFRNRENASRELIAFARTAPYFWVKKELNQSINAALKSLDNLNEWLDTNLSTALAVFDAKIRELENHPAGNEFVKNKKENEINEFRIARHHAERIKFHPERNRVGKIERIVCRHLEATGLMPGIRNGVFVNELHLSIEKNRLSVRHEGSVPLATQVAAELKTKLNNLFTLTEQNDKTKIRDIEITFGDAVDVFKSYITGKKWDD